MKSSLKADSTGIFEKIPVRRAGISLAVPTVISQIITVIYGMADTFFIGQMGDPNQVAAATLAMPPFILLTAVANLFGIGGSSLFFRYLGVGDREQAEKSATFSIWTAAAAAVSRFFINDAATVAYAKYYLRIICVTCPLFP